MLVSPEKSLGAKDNQRSFVILDSFFLVVEDGNDELLFHSDVRTNVMDIFSIFLPFSEVI